MIVSNPLALIGNTPLVRLNGPSDATGCEILGKCEFANPGASVKDRAALYIVEDAEATGMLKPGGTIVEGTAGNTGIGLALVANAKGYKTIIVMPETQSREKMDTLRALGAELVLVPAAPFSNPGHFVHTSRRIAEETAGAVWANQFDNTANRRAHIVGTAEEILYLLGILLHPGNASMQFPLIFTGPKSAAAYFEQIDQFLRLSLGEAAPSH